MIRNAAADDAQAIAAIWNPFIRDTVVTFTDAEKGADEVAALIAGPGAFLVWDDGGVRGFARYFQFRGGPGYRFSQEHTILLAPGCHGRGIGRGLMTALEARARDGGHRMLVAGVSGSNPEGERFHAALGYTQVGRIPDAGWKFGRFHDLVLMQKIL
jgi:L-amino acid N-acyltransferase